jgi:hypothetical protein
MTCRPVLIVRASIDESRMDEFLVWYKHEHLPHVMAIPGVVRAYRTNCRRGGINWTAMYELKDDASVRTAIASGEADRARRDWENWLPFVSDLSVEVYAQLGPLPMFHNWN